MLCFILFQDLPVWFKKVYINGKTWVYLINNRCKKFKVLLKERKGQWKFDKETWEHFIKLSGYEDITLLHFLNESADTYYVTGYDANGIESGGYGTLNVSGRLARCTAIVGHNIEECPVC